MPELPLDILPGLVSQLGHPRHLYTACLVNKAFYTFAVSELYSRIAIYSWQKEGKFKVVQLFDSLGRYPRLANHVLQLEIRDFPKSLTGYNDLKKAVLTGLRNCINLQACSWTRDGALSSDILRALQPRHNLAKLEINGNHEGNYDPKLLVSFNRLTSLTIIMPSAGVVEVLPTWLDATANTLTSLTIICKDSTVVTDIVLTKIAPYLWNLDHFYISGCRSVTHVSIWQVISRNKTGLRGLGLESLSSTFDMSELATRCCESKVLRSLKSITLTVNPKVPVDDWTLDVLDLLSTAPVEGFHVYSSGAIFESTPSAKLWVNMVTLHGRRLKRFSIHRMLIGLQLIDDICRRCRNLEELFIVVEHSSLPDLFSILPLAKKLRTLHINFPLESSQSTPAVLLDYQALGLAMCCSSTLTQIGGNTRVWQVEREIYTDVDGEILLQPKLANYSNHDVPEQFLVVRT